MKKLASNMVYATTIMLCVLLMSIFGTFLMSGLYFSYENVRLHMSSQQMDHELEHQKHPGRKPGGMPWDGDEFSK